MTEHWPISIVYLPINQVKAHDSSWDKLEPTQDFYWNCCWKGSLPSPTPYPAPGVAKLVSLELLEAIIATISGENLFASEPFAEENIAEK